MPKMKTHKGAAKRFKITKKGKIKHYNAGHSHLLSNKNAKRRRRLRKPSTMSTTQAKTIRTLVKAAG
ncbi:MAG: 50S ribosomal protein L35 [Planctomycetes bacterium]|nr:50S ribosomal protein L35 [Planctomycetota bacterium]NUQ35390.1 50S ribosomal protein L35 [Planctomycetaceae bacterium]